MPKHYFLDATDTQICRGFKEHELGHAGLSSSRKFKFRFPLGISEFSFP